MFLCSGATSDKILAQNTFAKGFSNRSHNSGSGSCRNLIKKPWAYNPQNSRIHIRNPNKDTRFLNQVPIVMSLLDFRGRV